MGLVDTLVKLQRHTIRFTLLSGGSAQRQTLGWRQNLKQEWMIWTLGCTLAEIHSNETKKVCHKIQEQSCTQALGTNLEYLLKCHQETSSFTLFSSSLCSLSLSSPPLPPPFSFPSPTPLPLYLHLYLNLFLTFSSPPCTPLLISSDFFKPKCWTPDLSQVCKICILQIHISGTTTTTTATIVNSLLFIT